MNIVDSKNIPVRSLDEWKDRFFTSEKKKDHWKPGRSASELAEFILNKNGTVWIKDKVEEILGEEVKFEFGIPEFEVQFDKNGHGREHDLGIFGKTESGRSIFIGVEAKVDESFGETIGKAYTRSLSKTLNGKSTNGTLRIEELLQNTYASIKPSHFQLRYQLLHALAGTTKAKWKSSSPGIKIFMVLIFKTNLFNPRKGKRNMKDYLKFMKALGARKQTKNSGLSYFTIKIEKEELVSFYIYV
jgi:Domain of unknown function (DUF6946)